VLLHVCCGVCAASVIEQLLPEYPDITLYYYNPGIHPKQEYQKRLEVVKELQKIFPVKLIEGEYTPEKWFEMVKGLESEPENGKRCLLCYAERLEETARKAVELGIKDFTTTLTISPLKKAEIINNIGQNLAKKYQLSFHAANFKKKDGYKRSIELAKKYEFYRQNYCGCIFSIPNNNSK